jgi:hypothetical protein
MNSRASSSCWLEQRTHNPLVPCSTHGGPTIHLAVVQRIEQLPSKQWVAGSSPAGEATTAAAQQQ